MPKKKKFIIICPVLYDARSLEVFLEYGKPKKRMPKRTSIA